MMGLTTIRRSILRTVTLAIAMVVWHGASCYAQWSACGPEGGTIKSFAASGDTVYAIGAGGLYRSSDAARTWVRLVNGLPVSQQPLAVAFDGGSIYVTLFSGSSALYHSTDHGREWNEVDKPVGVIQSLYHKGKTLLALTGTAIYRRSDDEATWGRVTDSVLPASFTNLVSTGSSLLVGSRMGLLRSSDDGRSWSKVGTGLPENVDMTSLVSDGSSLFVAVQQDSVELFRSSDNGDSWQRLTLPTIECSAYPGMPALLSTEAVLLLTTGQGCMYRSTDDGASWSNVTLAVGEKIVVLSTTSVGERLIVGTERMGVFQSQDAGVSWIPSNSGLTDIYVTGIAESNGSIVAISSTGHMYRSTDGGTTWVNGSPLPVMMTASEGALVSNGDAMIAVGYSEAFRSTNDGATWQQLTAAEGLAEGGIIYALFANGATLYLGTGQGLFRSTDDGASWSQLLSSLIVAATAREKVIVVSNSSLETTISTDDGATWINWSAGLPTNYTIQELAMVDSVVIATTAEGVYRNIVGGKEWSRISVSDSGDASISRLSAIGGTLYYSSGTQGVFTSSDRGVTWWNIDSGAVRDWVTSFESVGAKLFVGTSQSVRCLTVEDTTTSVDMMPSSGVIHVYPNPITDLITIVTDSDQLGRSFTICDYLGRVVSTGVLTSIRQTLPRRSLLSGMHMLCVAGHAPVPMLVVAD